MPENRIARMSRLATKSAMTVCCASLSGNLEKVKPPEQRTHYDLLMEVRGSYPDYRGANGIERFLIAGEYTGRDSQYRSWQTPLRSGWAIRS